MFRDFSISKPEELDLRPGCAFAGGGDSQEFRFMRPGFRPAIGNHITLSDDLIDRHRIFRECREQMVQELLVSFNARSETADRGVMFMIVGVENFPKLLQMPLVFHILDK